MNAPAGPGPNEGKDIVTKTTDTACACRMSRNRVGYIAVSVHGVRAGQIIAAG